MDAREWLAVAGAFGAGLLAGSAKLVKAFSDALALREAAVDRRCRKRVVILENQLSEVALVQGLLAGPSRVDGMSEIDALRNALANFPVVGGLVCSEGQYVQTFGYKEVLGHDDVEGSNWADPRFVDPSDLEESRRASVESTVSVNRGRRIYIKTAEGIRVPGKVYSAAPRTAGDRQYRFFLVVFDQGSLPPT